MQRVLLLSILIATAGPALAYALYPEYPEYPSSLAYTTEWFVPSFIEALRHCKMYLGKATIRGMLVKLYDYVAVIKTSDGKKIMMLLMGCWKTPQGLVGPEYIAKELLHEKRSEWKVRSM